MRKSLASFFSYLFMASAFVFLASVLCLLVIALRYYGATVSKSEIEVARYLLVILTTAIVVGPFSLYVSNKLGKLPASSDQS